MKDKISRIINESLKSENGLYSANVVSAAVICPNMEFKETFIKTGFQLAFNKEPNFYIYSATKTIIAVIILKLVEAGRLSIEDKLYKWFPFIKNSELISILNCLRHTGGLQDYGGIAEYHAAVKNGCAPWSFDEFINRALGDNLLFTPGEKFSYSNIGYMLLKKIAEIEYGRPFAEIIKTEISTPLGLISTKVSETRESLKDNLFGPSHYLGTKEAPRDVYKIYHPGWVSHGVVSSTAYETALIFNCLFRGAIFGDFQIGVMTDGLKVEGVTGRPFYDPYYGAGLMIDKGSPYGEIYGHTGGGPGSSAACYHLANKSKSLTAAVLTDGEDPVQAERIIYEIFKEVNS